MVSVTTQSLVTRVAGRFLAGFILFVAMGAIVATNASSQESASAPDANRVEVSIPIWSNPFAWPQGHGYVGWDKSVDSPNADGYLFETGYGDVPGLAIGLNGDMEYRPGGATWSYTAPGTTRIASAKMNLSYRNKMFAHHCLAVGLRDSAGNRDLDENCNPPEPNSQASYDVTLADPSSKPTSKEVFFNVRMPVCNNPDDKPCSKWIPSLDLLMNGPLARLLNVDMVLVDDDLPIVTPSGPFYELDGTYIDGLQSYGLIVDATDAGAGIKRMDIDHLNNPQLSNKNSVCDPVHQTPALGSRICPSEDQIDMIVDTKPMPEGTRRFDASAKDPAENVGHSLWTAIIDRTPPPAPNLQFLTPEEGSAQVEWDAAKDPILADGTPGSQTMWYRYRHKASAGPWSEWQEIPATRRITNEVFDQPIGTEVIFEVTALDAVRNESETRVIGGAVDGKDPVLNLTGPLMEVDGSYTNSTSTMQLISAARDYETGIRSITSDSPEFASSIQSCADAGAPLAPGKLSCPTDFVVEREIDLGKLTEGWHTFDVTATDRARNATDATIEIGVDRTPPGSASGLRAEAMDGLDTAELEWKLGHDPDLIDGSDGAGAEASRVRYTINGGDWSPWTDAEDAVEIPASAGDLVRAEITVIDQAGNASNIYTESITVDQSPDCDTECDELLGTLSVRVFNDDNANGWQDTFETQIGGRQLLVDGAPVAKSADDAPTSIEVLPGSHTVSVSLTDDAERTTSGLAVDVDSNETEHVSIGLFSAQRVTPPTNYAPVYLLFEDDFRPSNIEILDYLKSPSDGVGQCAVVSTATCTQREERRRRCETFPELGGKHCTWRRETPDFTMAGLSLRDKPGVRKGQILNNPFDKDDREAQYNGWRDATDLNGFRPMVYWTKVDSKKAGIDYWLTYWTFYTYDSSRVHAVHHHEGDWEFVAVGFQNGDSSARKILFGGHNGVRSPKEWGSFDFGERRRHQPMTYVSKGSHANFPAPIKKGKATCQEKWRGGADIVQCDPRAVELLIETSDYDLRELEESWACWPGRWGPNRGVLAAFARTSPKSPMQQMISGKTFNNYFANVEC